MKKLSIFLISVCFLLSSCHYTASKDFEYPIKAESLQDNTVYPYTYEVIADNDLSDESIFDLFSSISADIVPTENDELRFLSLDGDFVNYGNTYMGAKHIIAEDALYSCIENKVYIITYENRLKSFFYDPISGKHPKNYIEFGSVKSILTRDIYAKNDYVYVAHENTFYRFNKDGSNITPVIDRNDCNSSSIIFKIIGDYIYYSLGSDIIRTDLDGNNSTVIITDMPRCIISDYGFFAFSENSSKLIWYGFDGKIKLVYSEHQQINDAVMCGEYLLIKASDNVSEGSGALENAQRRNIILRIKKL